jgi:hypothetical protein
VKESIMSDTRTPEAWQLITFYRKTCCLLDEAYTPDERAEPFIALNKETHRQFAAAHGRPPASNDEIEDWVCRMTAGCGFDDHAAIGAADLDNDEFGQ